MVLISSTLEEFVVKKKPPCGYILEIIKLLI